MDLKKRLKREGGFTLIELIAVIIILGILAAVIVPKYFDMTDKAKDASYKGALNEGVARFNMAYAQYVMTTQSKPGTDAPTGISGLAASSAYLGGSKVNIGDYDIEYTGAGNVLTLNAYVKSGGTVLSTMTVPWPQ